MSTGGWQRSSYCWATPPSSLSGRQRKVHSPSLNTDPRRRRGVYLIRASMASGSTSRENDEEYQKFNSLLGEAPNANSQTLDAKSSAYADFADMLGLEGNDTEQADTKKSVAKLSSKKLEIDPADYSLFDAMLERTGGTGTKPTKGGKRYTTYPTHGKETGAKKDILEKAAGSDTWNSIEVPEANAKDTRPKHTLTDEEKAQAYAVMMEEFGPGVHDVVETWSPDEDVDELEPEPTQLLEPPVRPGGPSPSEAAVEYDRTTSEAAATRTDTIDEFNRFTLEPKPSRPSRDDQSFLNETANHAVGQDDMETADISSSSPPVSPPAEKPIQYLEDQPRQDEEVVPSIQGTNHELKVELIPPPVRSSGEDKVASHQALVVEPQVQRPVLSAQGDNHEENSTVSLLKPKYRPDPIAGSTTGSRLPLDTNTSRSRSKTRFSRNQRLKRDEPVQILKNPKLVYDVNE